jgi:diadenosine tetraphosphate (Ap4A) HIT family hydrolase
MSSYEIHSRLGADCHRLGRFELCHVLLHRNAALPWFILVPETEAQDLLDLAPATRNLAVAEAAAVSGFVKHELGWPKINFAAIGNVVPQLHLHVVGRRPDDPCWPAPVWGRLEAGRTYSRSEVQALTRRLATATGLRTGPAN